MDNPDGGACRPTNPNLLPACSPAAMAIGAGEEAAAVGIKRKREAEVGGGRRRNGLLLVGEKVEVRQTESGLKGSWHPGVVVGCKRSIRIVEYTELLCEDGSSSLMESVPVSHVVAGLLHASGPAKNYRGLIRPQPPNIIRWKHRLSYGLCVDAFLKDAWWEGVIFDHEESSQQRLIFFPDGGDERKMNASHLRITCDWKEDSGEWLPRGEWLYIEVLRKFEQKGLFFSASSIRNIWFKLSATIAFKRYISEWMCGMWPLWAELVFKIIQANYIETSKTLDPAKFLDEEILDLSYGKREIHKSNGGLDAKSSVAVEELAACSQAIIDPTCRSYLSVESSEEISLEDGLALLDNDHYMNGPCTKVVSDIYCIESTDVERSDFLTNGSHRLWDGCMVPPISLKPMVFLYFSLKGDLRGDFPSKCSQHSCQQNLALQLKAAERYFCDDLSSNHDCVPLNVSADLLEYNVGQQEGIIPNAMSALVKADCFSNRERKRKIRGVKCKETWRSLSNLSGEPFPQAIVDYCELFTGGRKLDSRELDDGQLRTITSLRQKVKKHLLSLGWKIECKKDRMLRIRLISPGGKIHYSLRTACMELKRQSGGSREVKTDDPNMDRNYASTSSNEMLVEGSRTPGILELKSRCSSSCFESANLERKQKHDCWCLSERNARFDKLDLRKKVWKSDKKRDYVSAPGLSVSTLSKCKLKRQKLSLTPTTKADKTKSMYQRRVVQSNKRALPFEVQGPNQCSTRSIFSLLIDNDVILPRQKVSYLHAKDGRIMAKGMISREGIKCMCCHKICSLKKFEAHAGCTSHFPAISIFLRDGRSLFQCQIQLLRSKKFRSENSDLDQCVKGDFSGCVSDSICSVCQCGGQLVLCNCCPSSFHLKCVGLEELPKGGWSCPSCKCSLCGQSEYNPNALQFTPKSILCCDQCKHGYHVECLRIMGLKKLETCPEKSWFCSIRCSKIFHFLKKMSGKLKPTSFRGLTWIIIRPQTGRTAAVDMLAAENNIENHTKLWIAVSVLHECFMPINEFRTNSDIITDIVFNYRSELNRLNFCGFYTVLLERDGGVISVATLRIHNEEVAEIPLICTRVPYRRQGMCRLLMGKIEKILSDIGVKKLILAAVPRLLETWTKAFGFSVLTHDERLQLLDYTFVNFQGTAICQKFLMASIQKSKPRGYTAVRDAATENVTDMNFPGHRFSETVDVVVGKFEPIPVSVNDGAGKIGEIYKHVEILGRERENGCKDADIFSFKRISSSDILIAQESDHPIKKSEAFYYSRRRKVKSCQGKLIPEDDARRYNNCYVRRKQMANVTRRFSKFSTEEKKIEPYINLDSDA